MSDDFNRAFDAALEEAIPIVDELQNALYERIDGRGGLGIIVLTVARGRMIAQMRASLTGADREHFERFLEMVDRDAAMGQELAEAAGYDPSKLSGGGDA